MHVERFGAENKIYGMTIDSTFHFDAARAPSGGSIRVHAGYGFKGKGSGSNELTAEETRDAAWLAAFASAADHYFAPRRKLMNRPPRRRSKVPDKAEALLADAKSALKSDARLDRPSHLPRAARPTDRAT